MLCSPIKNEKKETEKRFDELYKICYDATKCIIQSRELSKNQIVLDKYCEELTHEYNAFIAYSALYSVDLEIIFQKIPKMSGAASKHLFSKIPLLFESDQIWIQRNSF